MKLEVVITTACGEVSYEVKEGIRDVGAAKLLEKVVERLLLLGWHSDLTVKVPRVFRDYAQLEDLAGVEPQWRLLAVLGEKKRSGRRLVDAVRDVKEFSMKRIQGYLTSPLSVRHHPTPIEQAKEILKGLAVIAGGIIGVSVGIGVVVVVGAPAGAIFAVSSLYQSGAALRHQLQTCKVEVNYSDYDAVLDIIHLNLDKYRNPDVEKAMESKEAKTRNLEAALAAQAFGRGLLSEAKIEEEAKKTKEECTAYPNGFKYLTENTRRDMLKRCLILRLIETLDKGMQSQIFVGVTGKENAGKSSLIRLLGKELGRKAPSNIANIAVALKNMDVGDDVHTTDIAAYSFADAHSHADNIWLVDFPGSNSLNNEHRDMWRMFASLPNLMIYMTRTTLSFNNEDLVAFNDVCSAMTSRDSLLVLVNQMDRELSTTRRQADFDRTKCIQLRDTYATNFGIDSKNVLLTVVEEADLSDYSANIKAELEKRGVLMAHDVCNTIMSKVKSLLRPLASPEGP